MAAVSLTHVAQDGRNRDVLLAADSVVVEVLKEFSCHDPAVCSWPGCPQCGVQGSQYSLQNC